jgi:hypothetical protein
MGNLGIFIPILIFMIPIIAIWTKHQQRMAELGAAPAAPGAPDSRLADQAAQIRALEDRVRVLERIVTDGNYGIAAEIEALRDKPATSGVPLGLEKERL